MSEIRDARALQQEMHAKLYKRFLESGFGQMLGNAYSSEFSKGVVGGLRDAYRRIFEQGVYGKDVFDGRFHFDNQVGPSAQWQGQHSIQGMAKHYETQAASFYGLDQEQTKEEGPGMEQEREDELDMER